MKALILILTLCVAVAAQAATGFLVDEYTKGNKRYCVYDVLNEEVIITINFTELCPLRIEE